MDTNEKIRTLNPHDNIKGKGQIKSRGFILTSVTGPLYNNDFKFISQNKNYLKRTSGKAESEVRSLADSIFKKKLQIAEVKHAS